MRRPVIVVLLVGLALLSSSAAATDPQPRRYANLDELMVGKILENHPSDYIAAVIQVEAVCSMRCDNSCFDRVRIVELLSQAPPPSEQLAVGSEFHLRSGFTEASKLPDPAPRFLATVMSSGLSGCPDKGYYATSLGPPDKKSVESLRSAFKVIRGE